MTKGTFNALVTDYILSNYCWTSAWDFFAYSDTSSQIALLTISPYTLYHTMSRFTGVRISEVKMHIYTVISIC